MRVCPHARIQKILLVGLDGFLGFYFMSARYFTDDRTNLPQEAIGPNGSNCLLREICTRISKETYCHLWFSRGGGGPDPSGSAHGPMQLLPCNLLKTQELLVHYSYSWFLSLLLYSSNNKVTKYQILVQAAAEFIIIIMSVDGVQNLKNIQNSNSFSHYKFESSRNKSFFFL